MNLKKKAKLAEYIGYIVMPYNKFVAENCGEGQKANYNYHDNICLFRKDFSVGNPHGYVTQLNLWHPDTYWPHLMEVATFMVQEGLPVTIIPDFTPEIAFKEIMKTLKQYSK